MSGIRNVKMKDVELQRIIDFLAKLIAGNRTELADSTIMFFQY